LELQDLALDAHRDLPGEVAVGDGRGDLGDVPDLAGQLTRQQVDVVGQVLPDAAHPAHLRLAAQLGSGAHRVREARHLRGEPDELVAHHVDRVLELQDLALALDRDLPGQVPVGHRRGHLGDVAHLGGEVGGHRVDVVGQVGPCAADAAHVRLAAQL